LCYKCIRLYRQGDRRNGNPAAGQWLRNEQRQNSELGTDAREKHGRLVGTLGNLTLTGYNAELGNLSFADKKSKLSNTHIELNRWILDQPNWREEEIAERAEKLLSKAKELWVGLETTISLG
jgi:hypothetical protein